MNETRVPKRNYVTERCKICNLVTSNGIFTLWVIPYTSYAILSMAFILSGLRSLPLDTTAYAWRFTSLRESTVSMRLS